ncbi:hypothetical protein LCGC14_2474210, partial [marine sediment metagenome]
MSDERSNKMEVDEKTMTKILIDKLFARYAVLLRRIELLEDPACELPTYTPGQWYDWSGGVCPVDGKMMVKVEFRNKSRPGANKAETWRWYHSDGGAQADIVRFRIVPEDDDDMGPAPTDEELRASGYLPIEEVSKEAAKKWERLNSTPDAVVAALRAHDTIPAANVLAAAVRGLCHNIQ